VIYDRLTETQRHYLDHSNTVQCLDISADGDFAISGQRGRKLKKPEVRIWDLATLETFQVKINLH
jgi:WD40 repeat protein